MNLTTIIEEPQTALMVEVEDKLLCTTYPDELMDEKELTIEEQLDIKISWDTIKKNYLKAKKILLQFGEILYNKIGALLKFYFYFNQIEF